MTGVIKIEVTLARFNGEPRHYYCMLHQPKFKFLLMQKGAIVVAKQQHVQHSSFLCPRGHPQNAAETSARSNKSKKGL
jgi:hypothetical protein